MLHTKVSLNDIMVIVFKKAEYCTGISSNFGLYGPPPKITDMVLIFFQKFYIVCAFSVLLFFSVHSVHTFLFVRKVNLKIVKRKVIEIRQQGQRM